jgi:hypothetical protein
MKNNVPPLIQQIRENMLTKSNPENIRFNYMVSMEAIRDYADAAIREYSRGAKLK